MWQLVFEPTLSSRLCLFAAAFALAGDLFAVVAGAGADFGDGDPSVAITDSRSSPYSRALSQCPSLLQRFRWCALARGRSRFQPAGRRRAQRIEPVTESSVPVDAARTPLPTTLRVDQENRRRPTTTGNPLGCRSPRGLPFCMGWALC